MTGIRTISPLLHWQKGRIVRFKSAFQRFFHRHGDRNRCADHGVVAHAQEAHHLHMGRNRGGTGKLSVAVHPAHGVGHPVRGRTGSHVVGISTDRGAFYADLVIDACGMDSPVRKNLPVSVPVEKNVDRLDRITIYRAFFDRADMREAQDKFKVVLFADGIRGISWIAAEDKYTDLLIGRFENFDMDDVERFSEFLRKTNPHLGRKVLRGGQFVQIPVRQPLSVMVWDGYAAIGDSAFMTVPLIGSGIANSLRASRYLADAVLSDVDCRYDCETLWQYQVRYFRELGQGLAPLAAAKRLLLKMDPQDIDYFFESGTLNEDNITMTADFHSLFDLIKFDPADLLKKAKTICKNKAAMKKLLEGVPKIAGAMAVSAAVPQHWNERAVRRWAEHYNACFR